MDGVEASLLEYSLDSIFSNETQPEQTVHKMRCSTLLFIETEILNYSHHLHFNTIGVDGAKQKSLPYKSLANNKCVQSTLWDEKGFIISFVLCCWLCKQNGTKKWL